MEDNPGENLNDLGYGSDCLRYNIKDMIHARNN